MTNTTLLAIAGLFEGIRTIQAARVADFQREFERFKIEFARVEKAALEAARKTAPGFNIFTLLGVAHLEVQTHSQMIAHLLHPKEEHGQGFLFLESFLRYCGEKFPDFPHPSDDIDEGRWNVQTERMTTHFGRMDIVFQSPNLNVLYVIENKIYAAEQEDQLKRYQAWMATQLENYPDQALIYLTIRGGRAYTAGSERYYPISYREDIANWLAQAIPEVQAPNVKTVLEQYRTIVMNL